MCIKITLVGYYGYDNLGDDLMLYCLLKQIYRIEPSVKVYLLSKKSNNLISLISPFTNVEFIEFKEAAKLYNVKVYVRAILKSELTIWGGGTCFSDEDGIGNFKYFLLNILLGRKFAYLGIGIGVLNKKISRIKTYILLQCMRFATFRDPKSLEICNTFTNKNKDYLTHDLSYLYELRTNPLSGLKTDEEAYILASIRDLSNFYTEDQRNQRQENIVKSLCWVAQKEQIQRIFLLPIDNLKDHSINQKALLKLKNAMPNIDIRQLDVSDFQEKINIIRNAKFYVSERLHAIVISKMAKVPCIALSYSPKIDRFHIEIDSNAYVPCQVQPTLILFQELYEIAKKESQSEKMKNRIESKRILASKNIEILERFL